MKNKDSIAMKDAFRRLDEAMEWLAKAPESDLLDRELLANAVGACGLFHDDRHSPCNRQLSLYGNDVRYMLPAGCVQCGLWQTPVQLAGFLIFLHDKKVHSMLDLGTCSGWTVAFVTAYLLRFGLEEVITYDAFDLCHQFTIEAWKRWRLPIRRVLKLDDDRTEIMSTEYDLVFIDGNHSYPYVRKDYDTLKGCARKFVCFHDINDATCVDVVRIWKEICAEYSKEPWRLHEFIEHPNGLRLMGIGVLSVCNKT